MKRQRPVPRSVLVLTTAYTAAAAVGVAATGNREFLVYLAVVAAAAGVVFLLHRRVRFSPALLWGISRGHAAVCAVSSSVVLSVRCLFRNGHPGRVAKNRLSRSS